MDGREFIWQLNEIKVVQRKVISYMEAYPVSLIESLDLDLPTIKMQLGIIAEHVWVFNGFLVDLQIKLDGGENTLDMLTRLEHIRRELSDDYLSYKTQIHKRIWHLRQIEAEIFEVLNEGVGDIVVNQLEVKINSDALASS